MLILALDSCGPACSVCVWQDGLVLAEVTENMQRGQDARLMPIVVDTLATSGKEFSDLDRIAVTRGPGSFTGIRVGLAAARGIALASHKPVIGIDRFAIYRAMHAEPDQNLLVVIESRREELFCKFYPARETAQEAVLMNRAQIDTFVAAHPQVMIAGDIIKNWGPDCGTPPSLTLPARGRESHCSLGETDSSCARGIIETCARLAAVADPSNGEHAPLPLYLRAPDVTVPSIGPTAAISL